jgi:FkbM family methyltransferase
MNTICQYYYDNYGNKLAHRFYIEIGAFNGSKQNSTIVLEQAGWEGVCVEPMPVNIKRLKKNRKCRIVEGAVWIENGTVEFADVGIPGWTGIAETHQQQHKEKYKDGVTKITVPCYTFDSLDLPTHIDYFQIDTEGSELQILSSIDMNKYRIDYICIEDNLGISGDTTYHNFMLQIGYDLVFKIGQDSLYRNRKFS